jgi:putative endonuclease
MYYVYVLQSLKNARLYIGRTEDLKIRIGEHHAGKVWTTKRMLPMRLVFYESFLSKQDAVRRERYLKTTKGKSTLKMTLRDSLNISK